MASKKKNAPAWREGDPVALHGKVGKVIGTDGNEKIAVYLEGFMYPITVSNEFIHSRPEG